MDTPAVLIIAVFAGAALGVAGYRYPRTDATLQPVHDAMQTLPPFSCLLPTILSFGLSPILAGIATIVFALPPTAPG